MFPGKIANIFINFHVSDAIILKYIYFLNYAELYQNVQ